MNAFHFTNKPLILVAPLDWGLGHATRCIPIIRQLITKNCCVLLAGEEKIESLLKAEFPELLFIPLKGYRISYGKTKAGLVAQLLFQLPKLLKAIKHEHQWLEEIVKKYPVDAIISDNRYGLFHGRIYSIFITHQLLIKTPFKKAIDNLLQIVNYRYINQFKECWVPDIASGFTLAGALSHPDTYPETPVKYIGTLSRFTINKQQQKQHLLVLLSGPEPQRSILEKLLLKQLEQYHQPVVFIRGLPGSAEVLKTSSNIIVYNHLPANELEKIISDASFVISRCGYSTVMDLVTMGKKSILIPTPGQTEQEYLAQQLMKNKIAFCINQSKFKLINVLDLASSFLYHFPAQEYTENLLEGAIEELLNKITNKEQLSLPLL